MAISNQQSLANFANSAGTTVTRAITPGAVGDLIAVASLTNNGGTLSISDTQGHTWFTMNPLLSNVNDRSQSWYAFAKNTSATTITVTTTVSGTFRSILVNALRDTDNTPLAIGTLSTTTGSGNPTSSSFAPDVDDCYIWAWTFDSVTAVGNIDGSAATKGADDTQSDWTEFRILTGRKGVSMTAAFAGSGAYSIGVVCFRPPQNYITPRRRQTRPFPWKPSSSRFR